MKLMQCDCSSLKNSFLYNNAVTTIKALQLYRLWCICHFVLIVIVICAIQIGSNYTTKSLTISVGQLLTEIAKLPPAPQTIFVGTEKQTKTVMHQKWNEALSLFLSLLSLTANKYYSCRWHLKNFGKSYRHIACIDCCMCMLCVYQP